MDKVLLSIVIPVHNGEKYIQKCISSFFTMEQMNNPNFEIVVVDDGSTDSTFNICTELKKKYQRISIVRTQNAGVSNARNIGMENAKGKYIGFCDADDYVTNDMLKDIFTYITKSELDIIVFGYSNYYDQSGTIYDVLENTRSYTNEELRNALFYDEAIGGFVWNKIYKREVIKDIRFNTELSICEDMYFSFQVLNQNSKFKILYLGKSLYRYRKNELSASRNLCNLFDTNNRFKFSIPFDLVIDNCTGELISLAKSKKFECALSTYLENIIKQQLSVQQMDILKTEMRKNYYYFLKNRYVSYSIKIRLTLFWRFPMIKKITNKE